MEERARNDNSVPQRPQAQAQFEASSPRFCQAASGIDEG